MMYLQAPARNDKGRTWCGPYALALLSGLDYETAYKKILRSYNRYYRTQAKKRGLHPEYWTKKSIKGMTTYELGRAGKSLGVKIDWKKPPERCTVLGFARDHTVKGRVYLVQTRTHFLTVLDGMIYDNWPSSPRPADGQHHLRKAIVQSVAEIKVKAGLLMQR